MSLNLSTATSAIRSIVSNTIYGKSQISARTKAVFESQMQGFADNVMKANRFHSSDCLKKGTKHHSTLMEFIEQFNVVAQKLAHATGQNVNTIKQEFLEKNENYEFASIYYLNQILYAPCAKQFQELPKETLLSIVKSVCSQLLGPVAVIKFLCSFAAVAANEQNHQDAFVGYPNNDPTLDLCRVAIYTCIQIFTQTKNPNGGYYSFDPKTNINSAAKFLAKDGSEAQARAVEKKILELANALRNLVQQANCSIGGLFAQTVDVPNSGVQVSVQVNSAACTLGQMMEQAAISIVKVLFPVPIIPPSPHHESENIFKSTSFIASTASSIGVSLLGYAITYYFAPDWPILTNARRFDGLECRFNKNQAKTQEVVIPQLSNENTHLVQTASDHKKKLTDLSRHYALRMYEIANSTSHCVFTGKSTDHKLRAAKAMNELGLNPTIPDNLVETENQAENEESV